MTSRPTTRPTIRRHTLAAGATAALVLATLTGCATQAAAEGASSAADGASITGAATGKVEGTPDTLTVTLGVESGGSSAQEAMATNAKRATGVIGALKAAGVPAKDLQTTNLNVFPTFDDRGRVTGYRVSNMVTARLHDLAHAGAVIDAAAGAAGNDIRVQGMAFSIEDTGALMARARRDAVRSARAQAGQLARGAGVRLGPVRKVTEHRRQVPGPYPFAASADVARQATPIERGSQELAVDVTVVYEIRDR